MNNDCNNCDHKNVCVNCDFTSNNFKCPYWDGWHDAITDPPKEVKEYICVIRYASTGEYSVEKIIYGPDSRERRTFTVKAWRELPEYEV